MWLAIVSGVIKAWNGLVKLIGWFRELGIYLKGRADAARAQKEAERQEAEDARRIRDRMRQESDENLDDILGGNDG